MIARGKELGADQQIQTGAVQHGGHRSQTLGGILAAAIALKHAQIHDPLSFTVVLLPEP